MKDDTTLKTGKEIVFDDLQEFVEFLETCRDDVQIRITMDSIDIIKPIATLRQKGGTAYEIHHGTF